MPGDDAALAARILVRDCADGWRRGAVLAAWRMATRSRQRCAQTLCRRAHAAPARARSRILPRSAPSPAGCALSARGASAAGVSLRREAICATSRVRAGQGPGVEVIGFAVCAVDGSAAALCWSTAAGSPGLRAAVTRSRWRRRCRTARSKSGGQRTAPFPGSGSRPGGNAPGRRRRAWREADAVTVDPARDRQRTSSRLAAAARAAARCRRCRRFRADLDAAAALPPRRGIRPTRSSGSRSPLAALVAVRGSGTGRKWTD